MNVGTEVIDGVQVVRILETRLDTQIAPDLKTHFLLWVQEGHYNFLIDLSRVSYADSSGLGALLFGLRQARSKNGTLKVLNPMPRVANLIRIAQLELVLEIFNDEKEALRSFRKHE